MHVTAIQEVRDGMLKHLSFVKRWGNPAQREAVDFWRQKLRALEEAEQPQVVNFATGKAPDGAGTEVRS